MRRAILGLAFGLALAAAYTISQPPPPASTGELQFPHYSSPPVCDAGRKGRVYFDTDDNFMYYCNSSAWVRFGTPVRWIDDPSSATNMVASDNTGTLTEAAPDASIYTSGGFTDSSNYSKVFLGGSGFIGTTSVGTGPNPKPVSIFCDTQYTGSSDCISFWVGGIQTWYFNRTNSALTALSNYDIVWATTNHDADFDGNDATPQYNFKGNGTTLYKLQDGRESTRLMGTDLAVVGANQTVNPDSNVVEISAGAAASVSSITAPNSSNHTEHITFVCADANVTFNDADAAGAAATIDLAGAATNFVCSQDDSLTFAYYINPAAGNARWVEVARSVN